MFDPGSWVGQLGSKNFVTTECCKNASYDVRIRFRAKFFFRKFFVKKSKKFRVRNFRFRCGIDDTRFYGRELAGALTLIRAQ